LRRQPGRRFPGWYPARAGPWRRTPAPAATPECQESFSNATG
jgi:hypothetical protein